MKFTEGGRYRYYHSLFHRITHPGVKGLLIHAVKDEVNQALKVILSPPRCKWGTQNSSFAIPQVVDTRASAFLGEGLVQLLGVALRVDKNADLLREFDWYVHTE